MPTALVTGANRGIGLEVARQLAARGFDVLAGARDPDAVPAGLHAVRLDVTDQGTIGALRREVGELDVLVNNAAIHYDTRESGVDADLGVAREAFETNVLGAWRMTQACLPALRGSASARVVNVSSGAGQLSGMGGGAPAYRVTKTALNALTRVLANELRSDGILLNAVCPGWVATDMGGPAGRPVADGAASVMWAVRIPDDGPTGGFFRDGRRLDW